MSSIISVFELLTGPDQIVQINKIVIGQNNIPIRGERYLIQFFYISFNINNLINVYMKILNLNYAFYY